MKKLITTLSSIIILVLLTSFINWYIDKNDSELNFKISNLGISVDGSFAPPTGTLIFDKNDLENSKIDLNVKVNTIETGINMRDKHLLSDDFFNEKKYPSMNFTSTEIKQVGTQYKTTGWLRIKNRKEKITVPFSYRKLEEQAVFEGKFNINRVEYTIGEESITMGEEVTVIFTFFANAL